MPGYKPQVKSESGEMVDIPIAATYDENGNEIKKYVSTFSQTFTDEEKAQARKNIGAADASGGGKVYRHTIMFGGSSRKSGGSTIKVAIAGIVEAFLKTGEALTPDTVGAALNGKTLSGRGEYHETGTSPSNDGQEDIIAFNFSTSGVQAWRISSRTAGQGADTAYAKPVACGRPSLGRLSYNWLADADDGYFSDTVEEL